MSPTPDYKIEVERLLKKGLTVKETAKHVKIPMSKVYDIRLSNIVRGEVYKNSPPRKLTAEVLEHLKVNFKSGKIRTCKEGSREASRLLSRSISGTTVLQTIKAAGSVVKKLERRPIQIRPTFKRRAQIAKKYIEWTVDDWARVVWSNECTIGLTFSKGIKFVWDDAPGDVVTRLAHGTDRCGSEAVSVWSCMSWHGPGCITLVDETLDSQAYIQILRDDLQISIKEWGVEKDRLVLQHDNDLKHTSADTKKYLESINMMEEEGTLLHWPSQLADLNPIEHVWAYLEEQIAAYPELPKSRHEIWNAIAAEWCKIPVDFCRSLISSMPKKLGAVHRKENVEELCGQNISDLLS